ncbi:MAG: hypothetical protein H6833_06240 [Planctomycetes bacterium]|nr:hypothetical protein [Planctomycetota bacterium]
MTSGLRWIAIVGVCLVALGAHAPAPPDEYEDRVREARAALDAGRAAEAFEQAVAAARLDGTRFESYLVAALALHERGQHESAQDFAKIALQKAPPERRATIEELLRRLDVVL